MSQSRRFCRLGLAVAAGLIAVIGFVPSGSVAGSTGASQHATPAGHPGDWCC